MTMKRFHILPSVRPTWLAWALVSVLLPSAALANLLNIIGRRDGSRSLLSLG